MVSRLVLDQGSKQMRPGVDLLGIRVGVAQQKRWMVHLRLFQGESETKMDDDWGHTCD